MGRPSTPASSRAGSPGVAGRYSAEQARAAYRVPAIHSPRTRLLWIENTHNASGGRIWPLEEIGELHALALELDLRFHLDGARLLNASVALGIDAAEIGSRFDTVTLCLSKGLGCPLGAILAGDAEVMANARRLKHLFGGAMRQAGIVAAAGIYALDNNVDRLADDHARAKRLALGLAEAGLAVDPDAVETNFVQIDVAPLSKEEAMARLAEQGVGLSATIHPTILRAVTHLDVYRRGHRRRARRDPAGAGSACQRLTGSARTSSAGWPPPRRRSGCPRSARPSSATARSLWEQALGHADVEAKREATPQTQYRIGSITKTFTAVGILQLRDAGELSLDDPLTAHLPESAHGPTIGRMLAHSSGLQREPPGEIWETMKAPSREDLLAGTADAEQVLDPGTWWHYSNLAFALLGEVVARAHGGTWEEALQRADPRPARPRRARRRTSPRRPRAATSSSPTPTPSGSSPSSISAAPARSASSGRRPATWPGGARFSSPATTAC